MESQSKFHILQEPNRDFRKLCRNAWNCKLQILQETCSDSNFLLLYCKVKGRYLLRVCYILTLILSILINKSNNNFFCLILIPLRHPKINHTVILLPVCYLLFFNLTKQIIKRNPVRAEGENGALVPGIQGKEGCYVMQIAFPAKN